MGQENFSVKFRAAGCKRQQASDGRRALCRTPSSRTRELRLHSGWAGARVDLSDRSPMASEDLTLQPPWPRAALGPQPTAAWEGRGPGSRRRSTLPLPSHRAARPPPSAPVQTHCRADEKRWLAAGGVRLSLLRASSRPRLSVY